MAPKRDQPHRERERNRNFRCPDALWAEVKDCVELRNDSSISWVLRHCLELYVADTRRREAKGMLPYQRADARRPDLGAASP